MSYISEYTPEFVIATIIAITLLAVFILLLKLGRDMKLAERKNTKKDVYHPPSFHCPYSPTHQCQHIDTARMDKMPCKECEYYLKHTPST